MKVNLKSVSMVLAATLLTATTSFAIELKEGSFKGKSPLNKGTNHMSLLVQKDVKNEGAFYVILAEYKVVTGTQLLGPYKGTLTNWVPRLYAFHATKSADSLYSLQPLMVTASGDIEPNTSKRASVLKLSAKSYPSNLNGSVLQLAQEDGKTEDIEMTGLVNSTWENYVDGHYFWSFETSGGDYLKKGINSNVSKGETENNRTAGVAEFDVRDKSGAGLIIGTFDINEKHPKMFTLSARGDVLKGRDHVEGRIAVFVDIVNWKHLGIERFTTEELLLINPDNASDVGFLYERHYNVETGAHESTPPKSMLQKLKGKLKKN